MWSAPWMLAALLSMTLAACETIQIGENKSPCLAFEIIQFSLDDTQETIRAVRGHNAAWRAICDT